MSFAPSSCTSLTTQLNAWHSDVRFRRSQAVRDGASPQISPPRGFPEIPARSCVDDGLMAPRFAPLPASLGSSFSRAEARALGLSSRRLRQPDVERIGSALYRRRDLDVLPPAMEQHDEVVMGDRHSARQWCRRHLELLLAHRGHLPEGSFLIGRSAAVLWRLPVPPGADDRIEIGRFYSARASRRPEFRSRQLRLHLVRLGRRFGLAAADPATVWAMLAVQLEFDDIVALGDAVIRRVRIPGTSLLRSPPLARLAQLEAAASVGRRTGAALLREALPLLTTASASPPESHLRLRLRRWGAPRPELDHDVFDRSGRLIGCSEIAFPKYRLALEYEGDHHRTLTAQWNRDIEKYRHYEQNGWEAIRVTGGLLYRREAELRGQLFEALIRRGWTPGRDAEW